MFPPLFAELPFERSGGLWQLTEQPQKSSVYHGLLAKKTFFRFEMRGASCGFFSKRLLLRFTIHRLTTQYALLSLGN